MKNIDNYKIVEYEESFSRVDYHKCCLFHIIMLRKALGKVMLLVTFICQFEKNVEEFISTWFSSDYQTFPFLFGWKKCFIMLLCIFSSLTIDLTFWPLKERRHSKLHLFLYFLNFFFSFVEKVALCQFDENMNELLVTCNFSWH